VVKRAPGNSRPNNEGRLPGEPRWRDGNMTAEIAVLNKTAVALAADSTVTVGAETQKTYDTVNKLFTLSKFHPVGVMIFGNAEIMGYPWETVIKAYRESRGTDPQPTVQAYADDFFTYLNNFSFGADLENLNVSRMASSVFTTIREVVENQILRSGISSRAELRRTLLRGIRTWRRAVDLASATLLTKTEADILNAYGTFISDIARDIFAPLANQQVITESLDLIARLLVRDTFSPHRSGIVFAGFGETEFFPSLRQYEVDGVILGSMKLRQEADIDINPLTCQSAIIPFAVRDMADRFMEGADRTYRQWMTTTIRSLFEANSMSIIDKYVTVSSGDKNRIKAIVRRALRRNLDQFFSDERDYVREKFIDPVVDTIELLPKEELANLAESLVNLTYLKKRISMEVESVGGPIDVAVISKGDGFIWIKRKHYFKPEFNQSFMSNYLRRGAYGQRNIGPSGVGP
jgi:hypothetical protein